MGRRPEKLTAPRRRDLSPVRPALAACLLVVAACAAEGDSASRASTLPTVATSTTDDALESTTTTSTTEPSATSTTTTALPTTTSSTAAPTSTTPAPSTGPEIVDLLDGSRDWGFAGIERACVDDEVSTGVICTEVAYSPTGVAVSYDPTTRTLTRHVRENGEFVSVVLDDDFDEYTNLVAVGPHEIVYLNDTNEAGPEGSADLVAVTLVPGDAGREIARVVGRGNPGLDSDFVATPHGIVMTDWYGSGRRPAADRTVVMPWVELDRVQYLDDVPAITIDAYEGLVTIDGRTWTLDGLAATIAPTGMPPIVATFDGGFVARYDEVYNDYRSVVVRGWPDGSVEQVVVGAGPGSVGWTVEPEPTGMVLVPNGDTFVSVRLFESRAPDWGGWLALTVERGMADPAVANEYLAGLNWAEPQPPWDLGPVPFANAVMGDSPEAGERRMIRVLERSDANTVVEVTDERFRDDSAYASRYTMTIPADLRSVESVRWEQSCQPGRGPQDFESTFCL